MYADRRDLGIFSGLHPLARHRHQPSVDPDSEERSQHFMIVLLNYIV
jgi:hypothetical protein